MSGKAFAFLLATVVIVLVAGSIGASAVKDQTLTGTYLQFTTTRTVVIGAPTVTLGASSDLALYLYRDGTEETVAGLPQYSGQKNATFIYAPATVNGGKWVNPGGNKVSYTIQSAQPTTVTLIEPYPVGVWIIAGLFALIVWLFIAMILF